MKTWSGRPAARATTAAARAAFPQLAIARGRASPERRRGRAPWRSRRRPQRVASGRVGVRRQSRRRAHRRLHVQLEERAEQVACLVRSGHVAGLVLDPDAAGPTARAAPRARRPARTASSGSRGRRPRRPAVEALDQRDVVRHPSSRAGGRRARRGTASGSATNGLAPTPWTWSGSAAGPIRRT